MFSVSKEYKPLQHSGFIVQEVLTNIRTVVNCCSQEKEQERSVRKEFRKYHPTSWFRYAAMVSKTKKCGVWKSVQTATLGAFSVLIMFCLLAFCFWKFSSANGDHSQEEVLLTFFSVLMGVLPLCNIAPFLEAMSKARVAAKYVFEVIHRASEIDSFSEKGMRPPQLENSICFNNVTFSYPARTIQVELIFFAIPLLSPTQINIVFTFRF